MRRKTRRRLLALVLLAAIAAVAAVILRSGSRQPSQTLPTVPSDTTAPVDAEPQPAPAQPVAEVPDEADAPPPAAPTQADESLRLGLELLRANKLIEARAKLSEALLSGQLTAQDQAKAVDRLTELADVTLFSAKVYEGDQYAVHYTFLPGEVLQRVERRLRLHVPPQLLLKINGISEARSIRAGQTLKLLQGPFHAVVTKGNFTMDIYLHRQGLDKIFVKRLGVGLGKNGSTPAGLWRVSVGKKLLHAPWNPPPNSPLRRKILWGEQDYPLGAMGYWISLDGIDENTRLHEGYGIHGTNDPASIGKEKSLGCIRLGDADIELAFSCLYEGWSTVEVRP